MQKREAYVERGIRSSRGGVRCRRWQASLLRDLSLSLLSFPNLPCLPPSLPYLRLIPSKARSLVIPPTPRSSFHLPPSCLSLQLPFIFPWRQPRCTLGGHTRRCMLKLESIFLLRHRGKEPGMGTTVSLSLSFSVSVSLSLSLSRAKRQQACCRGGGKFWWWRGWMARHCCVPRILRAAGIFGARKEFLLGRVISDISCWSYWRYRWF